MFKKVLIANRGEIACRIAAVLRREGIASVAVYSEADAAAPHRAAADEAVLIGGAHVTQSYLKGEAIIKAALATGAEAVHPGYGLLSENAHFARRVAAAGLTWIGPKPEVIEQMGDKARARERVAAAGVPVVPGSDGPVSDADAPALAARLGYPVLVKAAAGGGGIGMVVVNKPERLGQALQSCRDRGQSSFGDATVYLEKLIEAPRHVEVQVLFDQHGHGVHLFERECTLQRRHQKVIEEAPSPFITAHPALRAGLTEAALKAARAVGYENAGTVEFIVDAEGHFYFIEMNTRLQVEHPVTEAITGVDLIAWQIKIAAGAPLTLAQAALEIQGHAIECRVYAEDPARKFIPRPGPVTVFNPPQIEGARVDAGVAAGGEMSPYYDPMMAKLIVHGEDRLQATARTKAALAGFEIKPIETNLSFLAQILEAPFFAAGDFDTGTLERLVKGATRPHSTRDR
ncbi:ATP-grasp domain-containing protein [Myxococcota bacterium]|nr:ATP-grasp domain-containing protein [Myxococcota bacterium]MBU1431966.1 ATP-grasp domain-containing protein [Myxococcota bacterium]